MWCKSNKCIAVREIVTDWMKHNAVNRQWTVDENLTTERLITLSVVGVEGRLELPNDEQTGRTLKRTVEDWLATKVKPGSG
jgi:hypothetical protein